MNEADDSTGLPPQLPKEDPARLVLRGRPRPVVRFRKGLLVALAAGLCAVIAGFTWVALEPHAFRLAANDENERPFERPNADALAGAPAAYSDVPKLGPPLPGDLGRPILEQQRKLAAVQEPYGQTPAVDVAAQAAATEHQRRASAEQAARTSALLAQVSTAPAQPASAAAAAEPADQERGAETATGPQERKLAFAKTGAGDLNAHALADAPSPWTLAAGTIIPASLITGLNSDLPGLVLAQVTENVRDTATGRTVLIPQGARLLGRYDSDVSYGQRRALLIWERIIFPNGASLDLDKMPGTDPAGYAGLEGHVNSHEWQLLKGAVLSTILGVGTQLSLGGGGAIARAIRQSAQQNSSRAGEQLIAHDLDVQPTLTVPPGWPVRLIVSKDLVLQPWKG
jgi:type IV secretion system protein VirB10